MSISTALECRQYGLDNGFTSSQLHCTLGSADPGPWTNSYYPPGCFIWDCIYSNYGCYGKKAICFNSNSESDKACGVVVNSQERNCLQKSQVKYTYGTLQYDFETPWNVALTETHNAYLDKSEYFNHELGSCNIMEFVQVPSGAPATMYVEVPSGSCLLYTSPSPRDS